MRDSNSLDSAAEQGASESPNRDREHFARLLELSDFLSCQPGASFLLIERPGVEVFSVGLGRVLDGVERIHIRRHGIDGIVWPDELLGSQGSETRAAVNRRLGEIRAGEGQFALLSQLQDEPSPRIDFRGYDPDCVLSELAHVLMEEIADEMEFYDLV